MSTQNICSYRESEKIIKVLLLNYHQILFLNKPAVIDALARNYIYMYLYPEHSDTLTSYHS